MSGRCNWLLEISVINDVAMGRGLFTYFTDNYYFHLDTCISHDQFLCRLYGINKVISYLLQQFAYCDSKDLLKWYVGIFNNFSWRE